MKKYTKAIDNLILLGLCILILGIPFSNSIVEIAAVTAMALWAFKKIFIVRSLKLERTPLNTPILIYLIFVALSLFNSQFFMTSVKGFVRKTLEYILIYFVIVETVNTKRDIKILVSTILCSCALIGADGLWQYFSGYDFLRGYPIWSSGRMTASFKFPNGLGGWLITVLPVSISLAIFNTKEKLYRTLGVIFSLLLFACLILNFTRGAIVAFIPAVIFLSWRRGEAAKKILLLLLVIAVLGIGMIAIFGGKEVIESYIAKGWSVIHRIDLAKLSWRMFMEHPFLGHGINTFMSIYGNYPGASAFGGISYAHNCYLQIPVETGIFSLAAFLWMIVALFVSSLKDINSRSEGFIKVSQIGLLAGLLAYLTHSAVESNLYVLRLAVLFYSFLGLVIGIQKVKSL